MSDHKGSSLKGIESTPLTRCALSGVSPAGSGGALSDRLTP